MAKQKKKGLPPIACKGCGVRFIPKDRRQKYHSGSCRVEYYDSHYYAKTEVTKICENPNCRKRFSTTMPRKQHYCSPECREEAQRLRDDGLLAQVRAEKQTYLMERYSAFKKDGFKCTVCGRGAKEGVVLDIEEEEGEFHTICVECRTGKGGK